MHKTAHSPFNIFIIGGGINGCGIARDAAGRGYSVALAEMNDFASATSSASTKLFHGGLRYLEFLEFRLVREALAEREHLLLAMPHISWPMRFILPMQKGMRFELDTPTAKFLSLLTPWAKGTRPDWLIRLGLFLYDHLGGRKILPGTSVLSLQNTPEGQPLNQKFHKAFEYSDCWVEDSRLTLLNAVDAQNHGAIIRPREKVCSAIQRDNLWEITTTNQEGKIFTYHAEIIVNAGGPWVEDVIKNIVSLKTAEKIRLVRGSHIVTRRLYEHEKCYFFQGSDGRVTFTIPYEEDFTLIGTTDVDHGSLAIKPICESEEKDYLIDFVNNYFLRHISRKDIIWSYSGVRPLYDDGTDSATAATRDYTLKVDSSAGAPLLNIFGGKITTYRKLAESALNEIDKALDRKTQSWTLAAPLPGGDIALDKINTLQTELARQLPFFDLFTIRRLIRQYGTNTSEIFRMATSLDDLGNHFGQGITARELDWAVANEWVYNAEDFLWRRSKMGLRVDPTITHAIDVYIQNKKN